MMCRLLSVARSGYYDWLKKPESDRTIEDKRLLRLIRASFAASQGEYGAPRVFLDLREAGETCSKHRVARLTRENNIRAQPGYRTRRYVAGKPAELIPDLVKRNFEVSKPNRVWVSDITYIRTWEGWLYLAVVIDLYSRLVVGWAMSERMTAQLVCDALHMALWRRRTPTGVIVHSDRGSQYCSGAYQQLIRESELICSMSARGNCYDNACAESFFHSLKVEAIHGERFATREGMRQAVFEYIEVDYNRTRRHSANGFMSPEAFEAQQVA